MFSFSCPSCFPWSSIFLGWRRLCCSGFRRIWTRTCFGVHVLLTAGRGSITNLLRSSYRSSLTRLVETWTKSMRSPGFDPEIFGECRHRAQQLDQFSCIVVLLYCASHVWKIVVIVAGNQKESGGWDQRWKGIQLGRFASHGVDDDDLGIETMPRCDGRLLRIDLYSSPNYRSAVADPLVSLYSCLATLVNHHRFQTWHPM